jgi:hypothetical protein
MPGGFEGKPVGAKPAEGRAVGDWQGDVENALAGSMIHSNMQRMGWIFQVLQGVAEVHHLIAVIYPW